MTMTFLSWGSSSEPQYLNTGVNIFSILPRMVHNYRHSRRTGEKLILYIQRMFKYPRTLQSSSLMKPQLRKKLYYTIILLLLLFHYYYYYYY